MPKQPKDAQEDRDKQYSLSFTKRELIYLLNAILDREYKIGDGAILFPAVEKTEAIIAVATNIPERQEEPKEGVILKN